jgi:hypothetical protein
VFYRGKKNAKEALQRFRAKTATVLARRLKLGLLFLYANLHFHTTHERQHDGDNRQF